ncbi:hypothetical protein F0562_029709 [Nyssa sinensis]|uniref:Uncharacterized protein n=1 Tax=Nyssa sinensis TaxID=561372 RepID=A0A5J5B1R8_9ASTE|nr:hypothetical protein F0562_029709 [Nyssa sinensis]
MGTAVMVEVVNGGAGSRRRWSSRSEPMGSLFDFAESCGGIFGMYLEIRMCLGIKGPKSPKVGRLIGFSGLDESCAIKVWAWREALLWNMEEIQIEALLWNMEEIQIEGDGDYCFGVWKKQYHQEEDRRQRWPQEECLHHHVHGILFLGLNQMNKMLIKMCSLISRDLPHCHWLKTTAGPQVNPIGHSSTVEGTNTDQQTFRNYTYIEFSLHSSNDHHISVSALGETAVDTQNGTQTEFALAV